MHSRAQWFRKEDDTEKQELEELKRELQNARDSLQNEIAQRWRMKKSYVEQREIDKEELVRLRNNQERNYTELARVKEEVFARQRRVEEKMSAVAQQKEQWDYISATISDLFEKEGEKIFERFPLDREERRERIETIRRQFKRNENNRQAIREYIDYRSSFAQRGLGLDLTTQTVLPPSGEAHMMSVARFGTVFAYAYDPPQSYYMIRQTGKRGGERYTIDSIGSGQITASLQKQFPRWIEQGHVEGDIVTDVLQSNQSSLLVMGREIGTTTRIVNYFSAGGPVMIPLLLLPFWAVVLIMIKLIQFSYRRFNDRRVLSRARAMLQQDQIDQLREDLRKQHGVLAGIILRCLDSKQERRREIENSIREQIFKDTPRVNTHINTLGIIAGVAPLLGLLGTVTGMIELFEVITHYGTGDPQVLAGGISEALITTQTGLAIAIPILLIHNYLSNTATRVIENMEIGAIDILNMVHPES
jgi:biopolymer transport protein ExbB